MQEPSDRELVQQVRAGKRQAFTGLMRRYQHRVYWIARRLVGSHEDADDVAQETFVKAYLSLGDFRNDARFFTWLYRIAVNVSLNTIRKKQLVTYLRDSDLIGRLFVSDERPDRQLELSQTEQDVHRVVSGLPERQRTVFVLRYFEGLGYDEISEITNTSVGGLKANYFHALKKLREQLSDVAKAD